MTRSEIDQYRITKPLPSGGPSWQHVALAQARFVLEIEYQMPKEAIDMTAGTDKAEMLMTAFRLMDRGEVAAPLYKSRPLGEHPSRKTVMPAPIPSRE